MLPQQPEWLGELDEPLTSERPTDTTSSAASTQPKNKQQHEPVPTSPDASQAHEVSHGRETQLRLPLVCVPETPLKADASAPHDHARLAVRQPSLQSFEGRQLPQAPRSDLAARAALRRRPASPAVSPTGVTNPELPAVHLPEFTGRSTDTTHPELAAQDPNAGVQALNSDPGLPFPASEPSSLLGVDDLGDEITDVRSTDYGEAPPEPVASDQAVLIRMDGVLAGEMVKLGAQPITLGRHPSNTLRVDDQGISRYHARILPSGRGFYLEDLDSRNGTFVQGQRTSGSLLQDGDWIQLGPRAGFRFGLLDVRHEELLRELFESSTRDALTGAFNRRHFDDRLKAEIAFARRHSTDASLLLIDIDHFKRINDTYGHPAGDSVLRQVCKNIKMRLRAEDILARVGGEEFAVILRSTDPSGAARAGERLRATVATLPAIVSGSALPITISIGCGSLSACKGRSADELVALADRRLYVAKHAGRNRVVGNG